MLGWLSYPAELRHGYRVPMAGSIIAATARLLRFTCAMDDPHIRV